MTILACLVVSFFGGLFLSYYFSLDENIKIIDFSDTDIIMYRGVCTWHKYHYKFDKKSNAWYNKNGYMLFQSEVEEAIAIKKLKDKHKEIVNELWRK